jgi:hypothetical protein
MAWRTDLAHNQAEAVVAQIDPTVSAISMNPISIPPPRLHEPRQGTG